MRAFCTGAEDLFDQFQKLIFRLAVSTSEDAALFRIVRIIRQHRR